MRALSLAVAAPLAAIAIPAAPAHAQFAADPGSGASVAVHRGDDDDRGDRRRHRRGPITVVVGAPWGAQEGWALYNNRSWEPESFNDWWHERPHRSYPRWVQSNQNCDRMWWGGGVWRCSW